MLHTLSLYLLYPNDREEQNIKISFLSQVSAFLNSLPQMQKIVFICHSMGYSLLFEKWYLQRMFLLQKTFSTVISRG